MTGATTQGGTRRVAILGNHLPRKCGIATFTTDLGDALTAAQPAVDTFVLAMSDRGNRYDYPARVRLDLTESDLAGYVRAADFLNVGDVDVVSVQHEYGIFGGKAGAHVLALLRELRMPIVSTLHTIRADPNPAQRAVMDEICDLSERIVVMSAQGADLLRETHGVPACKIDMIPHGIPELPAAGESKRKLGVDGRKVLFTFGLLSRDKGIEHVIDALPAIARRFPEVIYVVLGVTHPHVKAGDGETYRLMLESRGHRLGVDDHLVFHDRFVSQTELVQFLSAADIYITPYLNLEQITSGTLAFAVGSGKTVISTPYRYARELLADGRGALVPCGSSDAIAAEVNGLLGDDRRRHEMERRAALFGRAMTWPVVAASYLRSFERAAADHAARPSPSFRARTVAVRQVAFPDVNLDHLVALTDDVGLLQHAAWSVPRYEDGYCVDDNARALVLVSAVEDAQTETAATVRKLATRYLAFVRHAFDPATGRFRNFLSHARQWTELHGSEDSHGRALWSLGAAVAVGTDAGRTRLAAELFKGGLAVTTGFTSPRAWAYTLLGAHEYLRRFGADGETRAVRAELVARLVEMHGRTSTDDWRWFEDRLTYSNARLPQALIASGTAMKDADALAIGLSSLEWLAAQTTTNGLFAPIGSDGFYVRGGPKAEFDQQPVEACGMVSACLEAYRATGKKPWAAEARRAFDWFVGHNHLQQSVYDATTGGCRDGLHRDRPNENQGAEATLSFLTALMEMRLAGRAVDVRESSRSVATALVAAPLPAPQ